MATTDIGRAVPLLRGEYDPAQTYELNDIVSLNGSLYWHYSHEVTTNVAPQATSTWKVVLSLTDAEAYIARAESAAEEAESAKDDAVTAKTAAETASATATGASEAATAAKDDAVTARNAAQTAETGAVEAKNAAVSAKEAAQSAASSAGTSATSAGNSAGTAEYYATNAETAAETATTKASEASASASTASSAATTATEAKNTAVSSASTATTKAGEASTSATSAASSAAAAQAVKDSIPEDYSALSEDVSDLKTQLEAYDEGFIPFHPNTANWYHGYFGSTGSFYINNTNAAPTNTPFEVAAGSVIKIFPEGMNVQVQTYTYSEGVYTRATNFVYTTNQTLTFDSATYVAIHVFKLNGTTLTLDEVTAKIFTVSNTEKRLSALETGVTAIESEIGNTPMGTTAQTITGAIAEHENDIDTIKSEINTIGYTEGLPITIQEIANAANFVTNKPNGKILVSSTDAPIFTGTPNIIDLLKIKQGTFTDPTSGVTIEIDGNEVYIHGTTTAGFRFDLQRGVFYTDVFTNHPADLDIFPACENGYRLCFYEKTGYTMPSNIYFGALNKAGTTIAAQQLAGHSLGFHKNGTYIALYANAAITNINVKFLLGLKIHDLPVTIATIDNTPFMDYDTTIISIPGAYDCNSLTWTGDSTTYDANAILPSNPLTENRTFAWFGDSISQLRELPNLVSDLIGAVVYDCSFAGAPLTYGNPTLYEPTGFMSLCSQIVAGDFSDLSDALDAQEQAGVNVNEKRAHLATLQALDFDTVTDIVVLAGTNDFDNDYVNATNFVSGFSNAIETLLTAYPHLIIHVLSPIWRGDKTEGVQSIPTMPDLVNLEKTVASNYSLPFNDLYHSSGINEFTATVYLESDILHLSAAGDSMLANKCAKCILSN